MIVGSRVRYRDTGEIAIVVELIHDYGARLDRTIDGFTCHNLLALEELTDIGDDIRAHGLGIK
jgi:hypothetical protein